MSNFLKKNRLCDSMSYRGDKSSLPAHGRQHPGSTPIEGVQACSEGLQSSPPWVYSYGTPKEAS